MGKPLKQALGEVNTMIDRGNVMCELSHEALQDDVIKVDSHNYIKIKKEPIGITFMISPWNYPLLTVVNSLVPSILAGNPVLLKHSIRTPIVGDLFERAFESIGAANVVQHLFIDNKTIPKIYKHKEINFVGFTGSVETGKAVLKDIASNERFINFSFELGGKDPAYVREDADLKFAAESVADGATYNAGQSCCAVERAYVHESVYDEFVDLVVEEMNKITLGNPLENPSMGPMALPDSLMFLKQQVENAGELGAEIVLGGNFTKDQDGKGRFFEPTVIKNCDNNMNIVRQESFGPVLPIIKVRSDNEAIDFMNDSDFGLTASIYTRDYKISESIGKSLECGTVFMNKCDSPNPRLPWVGRKDSGVGVGLSKYGFSAFYKLKGYNFNLI